MAAITAPERAPAQALSLDREILVLGAVVVLGAIMAILDATIVNVAIPTLAVDLHASISTIQ
jgi:MFS family permease